MLNVLNVKARRPANRIFTTPITVACMMFLGYFCCLHYYSPTEAQLGLRLLIAVVLTVLLAILFSFVHKRLVGIIVFAGLCVSVYYGTLYSQHSGIDQAIRTLSRLDGTYWHDGKLFKLTIFHEKDELYCVASDGVNGQIDRIRLFPFMFTVDEWDSQSLISRGTYQHRADVRLPSDRSWLHEQDIRSIRVNPQDSSIDVTIILNRRLFEFHMVRYVSDSRMRFLDAMERYVQSDEWLQYPIYASMQRDRRYSLSLAAKMKTAQFESSSGGCALLPGESSAAVLQMLMPHIEQVRNELSEIRMFENYKDSFGKLAEWEAVSTLDGVQVVKDSATGKIVTVTRQSP